MSNPIDFYKKIFLHVIPVCIFVPQFNVMVYFVPRNRQINATRNQTRINLVSYQRRNQLLILEYTKILSNSIPFHQVMQVIAMIRVYEKIYFKMLLKVFSITYTYSTRIVYRLFYCLKVT